MKPKAILFDADGVLTLPESMFSEIYTKEHSLDMEPFTKFFTTDWADIVTGKVDLKESIKNNPDLWQWGGTPDELLNYWFEAENETSEEMISLVKALRSAGTPCYLATEQDKYRGEYMKNVMFKDVFDGHFITAELGAKKNNPDFFRKIMNRLNNELGALKPTDVLFVDDSQSKIDAAEAIGINAHLYTNVDLLKTYLAEHDLTTD